MCVHDAPFLPRPRLTHHARAEWTSFGGGCPGNRRQVPAATAVQVCSLSALGVLLPTRRTEQRVEGLVPFTSLSAAVVGFRSEALGPGVFAMPTPCHSPPPHCALQRPHRHHAIFRSSGRAGSILSLRCFAADSCLGAHSFVSGWPRRWHHASRMA